jgi:hypothetical protein
MSPTLEQRARAIRARAAVRRREARQRHTAGGVWFRVGLFLAHSSAIWSVPEDEVAGLLREGYVPEPSGASLEPPKILLRIPRERLLHLPGARALPVTLGPAFLAARCVVAVGFEG